VLKPHTEEPPRGLCFSRIGADRALDPDTLRKIGPARRCADVDGGPDQRLPPWLPGSLRRVGPQGPQPGASVAGRGGAERSRLDLVRHDSAADHTAAVSRPDLSRSDLSGWPK
jgi:hypothetical protein